MHIPKKFLSLFLLILPLVTYGQKYADTLRYSGQYKKYHLVFKIFPDNQHYSLVYSKNNSSHLLTGALNSERGFKNDPEATLWILEYDKKDELPLNFVRLTGKKGLFILNQKSKIVGKLKNY